MHQQMPNKDAALHRKLRRYGAGLRSICPAGWSWRSRNMLRHHATGLHQIMRSAVHDRHNYAVVTNMDDLLAEVRRLFARMTDYLWLAVALNAFIFGWGPLISHDLIFWSLLLHIPIEVVSTRIYGQTIGKKLFSMARPNGVINFFER